ncbi:glycosyltransferase involved in cell wall biosynthesis [Acetobacteroides hydrogenigenes]|uniref:Glycosyltransferase involved in cell wall biosynthesis n=2 Tax=Acetobacteroides hydrogenigenes TaxID=979970 RepID=A0A4R2F061_9BACT|nr:glycosyltransferase involved in cell wall biosynthesis [Acetobacteroides hydrogenigenes]
MLMGLKRALVLTYYWPPSGGAGVQRWLKFVKYLREYGYEPVVYTAANGEMPVYDPTLANDIPEGVEEIRTEIWEPYHLYKKMVGGNSKEKINTGFLSESGNPKFTQKLGVWIRGNFFIPDARCFWIKPSVKYLTQYLKDHPVDVIISTGPPHTMHMIALGLKRKLGTPWVADFRDPWTNIDFYKDLMLTKLADWRHHSMERRVVRNADYVVTVTKQDRDDYLRMGAKRAVTITNGYDEDDFKQDGITLDELFTLSHIGTIPPSRNPESLWKAMSLLVKKNEDFARDFQLKLVGKVDVSVRQMIAKYGLDANVNFIDYLPHAEAVKQQLQSRALLLLVNNTPNAKGILTGKFFEYLATGRPVVAIGPTDGEVAAVLRSTGAGSCSDFGDADTLAQSIEVLYRQFKEQGDCRNASSGASQFSRRNLTAQMAKVLDEVVGCRL